jgi:hypothetical protein
MEEALHSTIDDDDCGELTVRLSETEVQRRYEAALRRHREIHGVDSTGE